MVLCLATPGTCARVLVTSWVCTYVCMCGVWCAMRCAALTGVPPAQDGSAEGTVLLTSHQVLLRPRQVHPLLPVDGHANSVSEMGRRVPHLHRPGTLPSQVGPPPAHGTAEEVKGKGWVRIEVGGEASACPEVLTPSSSSSRARRPPAPPQLPDTQSPVRPPLRHPQQDLMGEERLLY